MACGQSAQNDDFNQRKQNWYQDFNIVMNNLNSVILSVVVITGKGTINSLGRKFLEIKIEHRVVPRGQNCVIAAIL